MNEFTPKVSVLIPVYNSAKYLRLCMNSLLGQSFEDYEIIAVNNGSEDNSLEILEEYAAEYPDKVFVYSIEHSDFVGTGRNFALAKARGKYIYICDSDDIVEKHALTWLYARAEYYNADVVYGYFNFVNMQSGTVKVMGRDGEKAVSPGELILTGADYWRRLYKKTLIDVVIEKVGKIPENTNFDDVAWLPVVHSYAKNIRSADRLIYNYFRRTSSVIGGYSPKVIEYSIFSENYAMDNCNPQYREYAELYAARRIAGNLQSRWIYTDKIIKQIKDNWRRFSDNKLIKQDVSLYNKLRQYNDLPDTTIPQTVYINGFGKKLSDEYITLIKKMAFEDTEVVILDESTCDVNCCIFAQNAYSNGKFSELGAYFALKMIFKNGGIYITDQIVIENPFNSLRYYSAFFAYKNNTELTGEVFGGQKGSEIISVLINSYEKNRYANMTDITVAERITNIICVRYGVKLNGKTNFFSYPFALLAPQVTVADIFYGKDNPSNFHICSHKLINEDLSSDKIAIIEKSTIADIATKATVPVASFSYAEHEEYEFYKERVRNIEESKAYKLALKLSAVGNRLKPLKYIAKKLIK